MIVKNEERVLRRCVQSIRSVCDEICIVDTGSTDGTVALAKSLGARVRVITRYSNRNGLLTDFASARNCSIAMATGSWGLWIDADEILKPSSIPNIRRHLRDKDVRGVAVTMSAGTTRWPVVRLFRLNPRVRFAGIVHELVVVSGKVVIDPAIEIRNKPDKTGKELSVERDTRLCALALRRNPRDRRMLFYMARALQKQELHRQAIHYFLRYVRLRNISTTGRHYALQSIAVCHLLQGDPDRAASYARKALSLVSDFPQTLCVLGDAYVLLDEEGRAIKCFQKALTAQVRVDYPFFVDDRFGDHYPQQRLRTLLR